MAPKYKLTYFSLKGIAEPIRFLLTYMGEDFEDNRIERRSWPDMKPNTPFGKLPVLEIDGEEFSESVALYRYLGKKANLAGDNDSENLKIDIIVDVLMDLRKAGVAIRFETEEEKKESKKTSLVNETLPFYFNKLEEIAKRNGGFLANNKLSWADFVFATLAELINDLLENTDVDILEGFTTLKALQVKVFSLPKIKEWITNRPVTNI